MTKVIRDKSGIIRGYGNKKAPIAFMLPTPPASLRNGQSIDDIVTINGNHWRKIFVIISKLCCGDKPWQNYRANDLLNEVYLNFSLTPEIDKPLNFICGKQHAQTLNMFDTSQGWDSVDELNRARVNPKDSAHKIIITPYLDYRQFPNALIDQVKSNYSGDGSFSDKASSCGSD